MYEEDALAQRPLYIQSSLLRLRVPFSFSISLMFLRSILSWNIRTLILTSHPHPHPHVRCFFQNKSLRNILIPFELRAIRNTFEEQPCASMAAMKETSHSRNKYSVNDSPDPCSMITIIIHTITWCITIMMCNWNDCLSPPLCCNKSEVKKEWRVSTRLFYIYIAHFLDALFCTHLTKNDDLFRRVEQVTKKYATS